MVYKNRSARVETRINWWTVFILVEINQCAWTRLKYFHNSENRLRLAITTSQWDQWRSLGFFITSLITHFTHCLFIILLDFSTFLYDRLVRFKPDQTWQKWKVIHPEAGFRRCFVKKVFLKFLQNSQENTCARASFLNKVTWLRPATFLKKRLWHKCFLPNFAKSF